MAYTTIDNPELYFQCKIWSGNATDDTSITLDGSENMQPDFIWTKRRNASTNHDLWDAVRGALKQIASNNTEAEASISSSVKSFNSDGFTVGTNTNLNASGGTYVAWCWKESATAGFDIVSYTGNGSNRTISHSLSAVPKIMIHKDRDNASYMWGVYHHTLGNQKNLNLNSNGAANVDSGGVYYNSTTPTSSVFSLGTNIGYNKSSDNYISYIFAEKQGFSKFGSYTGNGNADAPFIYTGFKPAMVILKETTTSGQWYIFDNKRNTFNLMTGALFPDLGNAETTDNAIDFYSNGFKGRKTSSDLNTSGNNHIYMAFAESPFVNSNGVPCNAR